MAIDHAPASSASPAPGRAKSQARFGFSKFSRGNSSNAAPRGPVFRPAPEPAMAGMAALVIGFYLALHAFYAPEFLNRIVGAPVPIVALLALLLPVIWFLTSREPLRFFETPIAIPYFFLLGWWVLAALVMSYKGYLIEIVEYGIRFHTAPVVLCGLLVSLRHVRTAILGYCGGFMVALLLCWKFGGPDGAGRFCILHTSLGNPNDLALNLVSGMAYISILVVNSTTTKRLIFGLCLCASMYFAIKTGSRANFLTVGVLLAVAWKVVSSRVRIAMLLGGTALVLVLLAAVPRQTWARLVTFESASSEDIAENEQLSGAIGSTEARKQLQIRAFKLTLQNPVFGVGPRMFAYALNDYMQEEGFRKGTWQRPHNTYLDVSSETGVIGVGFYIACILWCLRTNYRSLRAVQRRPDLRPALAQSYSILFASVVFSFGTLFCSIPYSGQLPFLLSLSAANWLALRDMGAFGVPPGMGGTPWKARKMLGKQRPAVATTETPVVD